MLHQIIALLPNDQQERYKTRLSSAGVDELSEKLKRHLIISNIATALRQDTAEEDDEHEQQHHRRHGADRHEERGPLGIPRKRETGAAERETGGEPLRHLRALQAARREAPAQARPAAPSALARRVAGRGRRFGASAALE